MLVTAGVVATIYGILSAVDEDLTQNIYMGAALSLTLLLVIVFCGDKKVMFGVCEGCVVLCCCGCVRHYSYSRITLSNFLWYPAMVLLSPLLTLLEKFRSIFPNNSEDLVEAVWKASPQLTLQIFIVLTTFDDGISKLQLAVILSSSMSLVIPAIEMYLQSHGEPAKPLHHMLALFPLFFVMNIFKILSISILLVFLTLPWVFILLLLSGTVYFILHLDIYGYSVEAGYQGWLHLTNLDVIQHEEDTDGPNPWHRKVSTIWYSILYSVPLVIILNCCNTNPNTIFIFNIAHWDYFSWGDLALVKEKDGLYLNITILTTLGLGVLGILMDFLYYCCGNGVFIFQSKTSYDEY